MITVELDPRLIAPPVKGVEYNADEGAASEYDDFDTQVVDFAELLPSPDMESEVSGLLPPNNVVILSQSARMSDTGQIVVDVLLDVEDTPGAAEFEVRMAVS